MKNRVASPVSGAIAVHYIDAIDIFCCYFCKASCFRLKFAYIAINTAVGDRWGSANAYLVLGMAERAQEQHIPALDAFQQSLQIFTDLGARWEMARVLSEMGRSTFALGNDSEAERLWFEWLRRSMETQGMPTTQEAIVGLANVQVKRRNYQNALRLLLFSMTHSAIISKMKTQSERLVSELKGKLTDSEIETAQIFLKKDTVESIGELIMT